MTTTSLRAEREWGAPQFASGKVILAGEHAVVYGVPAIACGLDVGARARARLLPQGAGSLLDLDGLMIHSDGEHPIHRAFGALLGSLSAPPVHVKLWSEIPARCGLGASAAHGVAIARAVLHALARDDSDHRLALAAATAWEKVFHGNPSGVDTAAVLYGGCIRYRVGEPTRQIALTNPLKLVVAIADVPASTGEMVSRVARVKHDRPSLWSKLLQDIAGAVREAEECLEGGRLEDLGEVLDRNHEALALLDLSTPAIERARTVAKQAGALGAKITGSGGGGAIVALTRDDSTPVVAALAQSQMRPFATVIRSCAESLACGVDAPNGEQGVYLQ